MKEQIKGIIFDFGGTLDTHGDHWGEVLWDAYVHFALPVSKELFREAYIYAERLLGKNPIIKPNFHFEEVLHVKLSIQLDYLMEKGIIDEKQKSLSSEMAKFLNAFAVRKLEESVALIRRLKRKYRIALVSNFYGNLHTILQDVFLLDLLDEVIESAVVGVRKPDPGIFSFGVSALHLPASSVVVIGDSYTKDMLPAHSLGCHTIWLKGKQWEEQVCDTSWIDAVITSWTELEEHLLADY